MKHNISTKAQNKIIQINQFYQKQLDQLLKEKTNNIRMFLEGYISSLDIEEGFVFDKIEEDNLIFKKIDNDNINS